MDADAGPYGGDNGFAPAELLLASLIGCVGVTFSLLAAKHRQHVTSIQATATGEQDAEPPWTFRAIEVIFRVAGQSLEESRLEEALTLAAEKYCTVAATLRGVAAITHRLEIVGPDGEPPIMQGD